MVRAGPVSVDRKPWPSCGEWESLRTERSRAIVRLPGEGWLAPSGQLIALDGDDTAGQLTLLMPGPEARAAGSSGPPVHAHAFEETFIVLQGEMTYVVAGEEITVPAGSVVHVPGMVMHTFMNRGDTPATTMTIASPPGIERFMRELAAEIEASDDPLPVIQRRVMARLGTRTENDL